MNNKQMNTINLNGKGLEARELRMIKHNIEMMKNPKGQLKTLQNKNSGTFLLLKKLNTLTFWYEKMRITKGHVILESSAQELYSTCGNNFTNRYNMLNVRRMISLLCLAGAIKVLSWDDLTWSEKNREVEHRHTYYQMLDLREADFSRIKGMDYKTKLSYPAVAACYGEELAANVFSDIENVNKRNSFDEAGLECFTNEIANRGVVTLQEAVALFKETQPAFDYKDKWFSGSLKALFDMRYFKGKLKLTTYAKSRAAGLDVTGNTKVIEPVKSYAMTRF